MVELKLAVWGVPLLGDKRVPGDWITGDRGLDMLVFPLLTACLFPLLRLLLERQLFKPLGERMLTAKLKKSDAAMSDADVAQWMAKWCESAWKATAFTLLTTVAFSVSVNEPWFTNPRYFWEGADSLPIKFYVPRKMLVAYIIEAAFYLQAIPYLIFVETRRKDWWSSMAHHIVTVALIYYSWYTNFIRPGVIVMQLHDVSDVVLELAKLCRYAGYQDLSTGVFIVFTASWIYLRLWVYPKMIVLNCLHDPVALVANIHGIDPQPHYAMFGTLFTLLYFLHVYWTYFILMVIVRALTKGDVADVREDDDD